jgi:hypothetical protein
LTTSTSTAPSVRPETSAAGARFSTIRARRHRPAARTVASIVSTGISPWATTTRAPSNPAAAAAATISRPSERFAAGTIEIEFSPAASTVMCAEPESMPGIRARREIPTPCSASEACREEPAESSPTQPRNVVGVPVSAVATAWLAPLPPSP